MPQNETKMLCGWKHCDHESPEISSGDEFKLGNKWYHKDCAKRAKGIQDIKAYYYENIDRAVVMKLLGSAANNIVVNKGVDPNYVLFALKYAVKNDIPINSPYTIHYLIGNYKIKDAWKRYQKRLKAIQVAKQTSDIQVQKKEVTENNKYQKNSVSFGDIFK